MASWTRGLLGRAAVALIATVGAACVAYGAREPVAYRDTSLSPPIARAGNAVLERVIVTELNRTRRAAGLRELRVVIELRVAGRAHASVLASSGAFTHDWPKTEAPFGRWIVRFYPGWRGRRWMAGENLLWAEVGLTAKQAVRMWLQSPEHRRILLAPTWREIGVGVVRVRGAGGVYGRRDVYVVAAEFGAR